MSRCRTFRFGSSLMLAWPRSLKEAVQSRTVKVHDLERIAKRLGGISRNQVGHAHVDSGRQGICLGTSFAQGSSSGLAIKATEGEIVAVPRRES